MVLVSALAASAYGQVASGVTSLAGSVVSQATSGVAGGATGASSAISAAISGASSVASAGASGASSAASAGTSAVGGGASSLRSGMPGKIKKVFVKEGDEVNAGTPLLVMEAMKMENEMKAPANVKITKLHVKPGDNVSVDPIPVRDDQVRDRRAVGDEGSRDSIALQPVLAILIWARGGVLGSDEGKQ